MINFIAFIASDYVHYFLTIFANVETGTDKSIFDWINT